MKLIKQTMLGLALICMVALYPGIMPVFAASSYSDPVAVSIQYTQNYDADSIRANESFQYIVTPKNGAPAPKEASSDGTYIFTVKAEPKAVIASGTVDLNIMFPADGEYLYEIKSYVNNPVKNVEYDKTIYTAHVYVKSGKDGIKAQLILTDGESGKKCPDLEFNHSYKQDSDDSERPISTPEGDGDVDDNTPKPTGRTNRDDGGDGNDGGGGNGRTAQGDPDGPAQDNYEEEEDDGDKSIVERIIDAVPKADPNREYWAVLNLIVALINIILAVIMAVRYFQRVDTDDDEYAIRRGGKWRLAGIPPAVISAVVFFLTEDIGKEMKLTDEWTPFMMIMLLISMFVAGIVYKTYDKKEDDEQNGIPA